MLAVGMLDVCFCLQCRDYNIATKAYQEHSFVICISAYAVKCINYKIGFNTT